MVTRAFDVLPACDLPDPTLLRMYQYWARLRGSRAGPSREEIDPVDLPREALPDLMLTEVVNDAGSRRYRYRLVGSRIAELAGRDPTRQFLDEALPDAFGYRDYILGLYDALADGREPVYSRSVYVTEDPTRPPQRETYRLMLPLCDGEAVSHVLAIQVFQVQQGVRQKPFLAPDSIIYGDSRVVVPDS